MRASAADLAKFRQAHILVFQSGEKRQGREEIYYMWGWLEAAIIPFLRFQQRYWGGRNEAGPLSPPSGQTFWPRTLQWARQFYQDLVYFSHGWHKSAKDISINHTSLSMCASLHVHQRTMEKKKWGREEWRGFYYSHRGLPIVYYYIVGVARMILLSVMIPNKCCKALCQRAKADVGWY